jgi:hypothetical protein
VVNVPAPPHSEAAEVLTVDILDAHLLEPTGLHDASDPGSIVAVGRPGGGRTPVRLPNRAHFS